jgi:hypothetical protein
MLVISAARPGLKIIPPLLMVLMDLITDLTTIASGLPMLVNTNNLRGLLTSEARRKDQKQYRQIHRMPASFYPKKKPFYPSEVCMGNAVDKGKSPSRARRRPV